MTDERPTQEQLIGGRYALERRIGQGGMAEVWRARHVALNTYVAIKFLCGTSASKESTRKRFLQEAQVTAQLRTRYAVQVFDYGVTDSGWPYLAMELLDGETLAQRILHAGKLSPDTTVRILRQAARALDRAHASGIVHRDFKPENIFLTEDEEGNEIVKVMDFGIARLLHDLDTETYEQDMHLALTTRNPLDRRTLTTFTRTRGVLGTPAYMAPEQVRMAVDLGPRADLWAFGVVAFECLTGRVPFSGYDLDELFESILRRSYPLASSLNPAIPTVFDEWFLIACAIDPAQRFAGATVALTALATALHNVLGEEAWGSASANAALSDGSVSMSPPGESSQPVSLSLPKSTPKAEVPSLRSSGSPQYFTSDSPTLLLGLQQEEQSLDADVDTLRVPTPSRDKGKFLLPAVGAAGLSIGLAIAFGANWRSSEESKAAVASSVATPAMSSSSVTATLPRTGASGAILDTHAGEHEIALEPSVSTPITKKIPGNSATSRPFSTMPFRPTPVVATKPVASVAPVPKTTATAYDNEPSESKKPPSPFQLPPLGL